MRRTGQGLGRGVRNIYRGQFKDNERFGHITRPQLEGCISMCLLLVQWTQPSDAPISLIVEGTMNLSGAVSCVIDQNKAKQHDFAYRLYLACLRLLIPSSAATISIHVLVDNGAGCMSIITRYVANTVILSPLFGLTSDSFVSTWVCGTHAGWRREGPLLLRPLETWMRRIASVDLGHIAQVSRSDFCIRTQRAPRH